MDFAFGFVWIFYQYSNCTAHCNSTFGTAISKYTISVSLQTPLSFQIKYVYISKFILQTCTYASLGITSYPRRWSDEANHSGVSNTIRSPAYCFDIFIIHLAHISFRRILNVCFFYSLFEFCVFGVLFTFAGNFLPCRPWWVGNYDMYVGTSLTITYFVHVLEIGISEF